MPRRQRAGNHAAMNVNAVKGDGFSAVRSAAAGLPGVEVTTTWGAPTLKVRGKMFVCMAVHKSAEPNTLVVRMDFAQRDILIEEDPETYYLEDHYVEYPCVLVRLSRVHPDALRDLVHSAYRYIAATLPAGGARRRVWSPRQARRRNK